MGIGDGSGLSVSTNYIHLILVEKQKGPHCLSKCSTDLQSLVVHWKILSVMCFEVGGCAVPGTHWVDHS